MTIKIEYNADADGYFANTVINGIAICSHGETEAQADERLIQKVKRFLAIWNHKPQPKEITI